MIAVFPNTTLADTANTDRIARALDEEGAVIVERVAPPDLVDRVVTELRPHFDREGWVQAEEAMVLLTLKPSRIRSGA